MVDEESPEGLEGIAVVGMSVRLPGAADLETFWRNLREGVESIRFFSDEELRAAGVDPAQLQDPNYVKARGALDGVDLFDAGFFGFTPREAETMDPQHRLFLEEAWRALEHAGCNPDVYDGAIGVFAGANLTGYLLRNLAPNDELVRRVGPLQIRIRNDKDFLATLVAYKLNLRGPAVNVQTACSSSLVGVALACQSLLSYQCDMALAGGVSVTVPNHSGYLYQEGVYAPDGHCRAFDARARGTVLGDGAAVVVLKRLEDARADGDTVHAVIRGFAVNNDGSLKLDYTAPSVEGQAEVIGMAQSLGEIDPETVTYIEAHGTGTPLGDPIEVTALTQAFRRSTDARGFCALGSLKTNIGHLDAAAGTSGLIKTVLALGRREIPPTLHFTQPNPLLELESSPFYVAAELTPWEVPDGMPRRAGVSSFGVGGTNAHVVLEEAPAAPPPGPSRPWQLLVLSARTAGALEQASADLAACLDTGVDLADAAFTLARGRKAFEMRQALVCRDAADAAALLRGAAPRRIAAGEVKPGTDRAVAFLFSGIGDHYVGMGRDLYDHEPVYREEVDRCAEILRPLLGLDVRHVLYPEGRAAAAGGAPDLRRMLGRGETAADPQSEPLSRTGILHPALFVVEHALARLWMSWGIRPGAMIGYSIGEYVAACLAGVFSLEGALRLVAQRARIIDQRPEGAMLAVSLPEPEVRALLAGERFRGLSLAAVNGPAFCVVAGGPDDVAELEAELGRREAVHRRLRARHPFHSRLLEPALPDFRAALHGIALSAPAVPFLSNVTGTWITAEEATDPAYWAEHMCRTVRFGEGVAELLRRRDWALLEIGPGQSLSSIALQSAEPSSRSVALPSLPHEYDPQPAQAFLLHALGRLWTAGVQPDWQGFHAGEERRRIPLPTYPFERRRYWIDPVARQTAAPQAASLDKKPDPGDWFYVPVWRQAGPAGAAAAADGPWLVFEDGTGLGRRLAAALEAEGREVVSVEPGELFARLGGRRFALDPGRPQGYEELLRSLAGEDLLPRHAVHLWSLPAAGEALDRGFYSLLFLAQAWGSVAGQEGRELSLTAVSGGAFDVTGEEGVEPAKAALAGPCRVIPQEYPGIVCRQVDLPRPGEAFAERWLAPLRAELGGTESAVALRGRRRWLRGFEPVRLGEPEATRLRRNGVYVITGGTGGIGLTLAAYLAERFDARLVLVGRSEPTGERLRRLEALKAAGAEVLVCRADVLRRDEMEGVRRAALERFGAVHGVIHAAGQAPGGLIQLKSRGMAEAVLAPKVEGTRILDEVFGGPDLDFLLLCSSLTSLTGALGLVDHAAANAFLDAYAQRSASRGGTRIVSVNWDSWLEVGQAAEAGVSVRLGSLLGEPEAVYPHWEQADGGALLTRLPADHWLVAEHRLQGVGLVPGTAYLEMARRAVEERGQRVSLRNVTFSQPCTVPAGQVRLLRVRPDGDQVVIESGQNGQWQEHARARVELLPEAAGGRHDFPTAFPVREIHPGDDRLAEWVEFGERWRGLLRELRCNEEEGWARLELPEDHRGDLEHFGLHPALADVATGIVRVLGDAAWLPLGYDEVTIHDRLPARVQVHFRLRGQAAGSNLLVCDVTVGDPEGRVLLDVRGYAMRRLEAPPVPATAPPARGGDWSLGILPQEGAEAFGRLLASALDEPQWVVSVRDFAAVQDRIGSLTGSRAAEHIALLGSGRDAGHRAAARAPYAPPRSDLEIRLVELYQDMLGVGDVGIHDNFFDLGGNSLVATQLISRVRESFEVEIALRALFEAPTVAELGVVIVREQAALVDEDELSSALAELSQLTREELVQRLSEVSEEEVA
ncbi:MAG: SDR family NAD(P)-dependent oxidoreductase [Thermoanaerobaculia bacterium]